MTDLVIGGDLGGTTSRLLVATIDGVRVGAARGGPANPTTHGVRRAAAELGAVARRALAGVEAGRVRAVVLGVAGRATLDDPAAARAFGQTLTEVQALTGVEALTEVEALTGAGVAARFVPDTEVAFCSATPVPDGTVLVAGTGAMAVRIRGRRTAATSDGLGWLLGDEGSAFWIGRAGVRAALAAIGGTGPATSLVDALVERLLTEKVPADRQRSELIRAVARGAPIELAALAQQVAEAEQAGDAVAAAVCAEAAALLARTVDDVRVPGPLVLGGAVVRSPESPVGRRLRALLPPGEVLTAADGTAGAAWLAVRDLRPDWSEQRLGRVHQLLGHV